MHSFLYFSSSIFSRRVSESQKMRYFLGEGSWARIRVKTGQRTDSGCDRKASSRDPMWLQVLLPGSQKFCSVALNSSVGESEAVLGYHLD